MIHHWLPLLPNPLARGFSESWIVKYGNLLSTESTLSQALEGATLLWPESYLHFNIGCHCYENSLQHLNVAIS